MPKPINAFSSLRESRSDSWQSKQIKTKTYRHSEATKSPKNPNLANLKYGQINDPKMKQNSLTWRIRFVGIERFYFLRKQKVAKTFKWILRLFQMLSMTNPTPSLRDEPKARSGNQKASNCYFLFFSLYLFSTVSTLFCISATSMFSIKFIAVSNKPFLKSLSYISGWNSSI